jgi:hypothetical protein
LSDFTYKSEHQKKRSVRCDHICVEVMNDEANLKHESQQIKQEEKPTDAFCNFMITKMNEYHSQIEKWILIV